jgi:type I restriction enzyme R subunit
MNMGIYEIENTDVLKLDPLKQYGSPAKIVAMFGGKAGYIKALQELEAEIYGVA